MPRAKPEPLDRETLDYTGSYSVVQVAHLVGWSPKWLRQLVREGRVKAFRPGGHEYRIPGAEIKRILENLQHHSQLPPLPGVSAQVDVLEVSPELMPKVDPNWGKSPAEHKSQEEPPAKGFWDSIDDDLRQGNPLLFGAGE